MPVKAVLHTGLLQPWIEPLGDIPWPLLPVGNRPFLEYWFETCLDWGIREVRLVLGEGAEFVEAYAGDGEEWGLTITYSFLRDHRDPVSFLKRNPEYWEEGLFYLQQPVFLHRLSGEGTLARFPGGIFLDHLADGTVACLISDSREFLRRFMENSQSSCEGRPFADLNLRPQLIGTLKEYYDLNMRVVGVDARKYLKAGYSPEGEVSIGYNVILPPSVTVLPPVAIGNNSRIGAMTSVGPLAVVGNHAIIDRQAELSECVVLDGTYVGCGLEIRGKIVSGSRLVDPESGTVAEINDPLLVDHVRPLVRWGDFGRAVFGWVTAVILVFLQSVPFAVLYPFVKLFRKGRFRSASVHLVRGRVGQLREFVPCSGQVTGLGKVFQCLNLDLFPQFFKVVAGHLWLCGVRPMSSPCEDSFRSQVKEYYPAVLVYDEDDREQRTPGGHVAEALYYARFRSLFGDVKSALAVLLKRSLTVLSADL